LTGGAAISNIHQQRDNELREPSRHENTQDNTEGSTSLIGSARRVDIPDHRKNNPSLPQFPGISVNREDLAAIAGVIDNAISARFREMQRDFHCGRANQVRPPGEDGYNHSEEHGGNLVSQIELGPFSLDSQSSSSIVRESAVANIPPNVNPVSCSSHTICNCHPQIRKGSWTFSRASLMVRVKLVNHHAACDTRAGCRDISLQIRAFKTAVWKSSVSLDPRCRISLTQSVELLVPEASSLSFD
jgi:hypothetical protein